VVSLGCLGFGVGAFVSSLLAGFLGFSLLLCFCSDLRFYRAVVVVFFSCFLGGAFLLLVFFPFLVVVVRPLGVCPRGCSLVVFERLLTSLLVYFVQLFYFIYIFIFAIKKKHLKN